MPMPPPPPPGPPLPPNFPPPGISFLNISSGKLNEGGSDGRGILLQSIRQGKKLKKTVTNDKSAPAIPGTVSSSYSNSSDTGQSSISRTTHSNNQSTINGLGLGSLFAGGIPKLRPVANTLGGSQSSLNITSNNSTPDGNQNTSTESIRNPINGSNHLSDVLKKQMSTDFRHRGPPPQPPSVPVKNHNDLDSIDSSNISNNANYHNKNINPSNQQKNIGTVVKTQGNNSFLHNVTNSSCSMQNNMMVKSGISHGKPNLAPKPPAITSNMKPATPPKKLTMNGRIPVSRAQSMRMPRSPPVAPPTNPPFPPMLNGKDYGSMRRLPSAFHQSQENLTIKHTHSRNQTLPVNLNKSNAPQPPLFNSRPNGPPPSRPPVPPPPSRTGSNMSLKAPLSPPPPPPVSAPPPPPHRTSPAPPAPSHTRQPPAIPSNGPPPPPVRNSSMRNGSANNLSPCLDMDTRFANLFHPVTDFTSPPPFQGLHKIYGSKSALSKQQAPLPPNSIHLGTKLWDSSTC